MSHFVHLKLEEKKKIRFPPNVLEQQDQIIDMHGNSMVGQNRMTDELSNLQSLLLIEHLIGGWVELEVYWT